MKVGAKYSNQSNKTRHDTLMNHLILFDRDFHEWRSQRGKTSLRKVYLSNLNFITVSFFFEKMPPKEVINQFIN